MEFKDFLASKPGANSFTAWGKAGEKLKLVVEALLSSKMHVICTMRSTMEYVQEKDDKGKTTIRKVGLSPVMRKNIEYEFTVVGDVNDSTFTETKTRCRHLKNKSFFEPGKDIAKILLDWLEAKAVEPPEPTRLDNYKQRWGALRDEHELDNRILSARIRKHMKCTFKEIQDDESLWDKFELVIKDLEDDYDLGEPPASTPNATEQSHEPEPWTDEQNEAVARAFKMAKTTKKKQGALMNAADENGWTPDQLIDKIGEGRKVKSTPEPEPEPKPKPEKPRLNF